MDKIMKQQQQDKMFQFEKKYKQLKHIIVTIFLIGLMFMIIILLAAIIYFHQLTKDASSINDHALKHKVIHFVGDDLINYKNNDILDEYDHSLNSLIVGPKHVSQTSLKH